MGTGFFLKKARKNTKNMEPLSMIAGAGMGLINREMGLDYQRRQQDIQLQGHKKSLQQSNDAAFDLWQRTNYSEQIKQLDKAGLNAGLIYGMGGAGGTTGGGGAMPAAGGGDNKVFDMGQIAQFRLLEAQAKKLEAETKNIETDTEGKGYEAKIKAANSVIAEILKDEKGMDFWDYYGDEGYIGDDGEVYYYENPIRTQRKQTAMEELKSREGTAKNIVEQFKNGNLAKMSQAQLDDMLKGIGVKEGTIKKLDLENQLTEMDKKLWEKIGLGKESKGWLDSGVNLILNIIRMSMQKNR